MIIVRPNLYIPGTVIRSAEVNDDFDTIYNDYNGNIDNDNITALARIEVSKLEDMDTGEIIVGETATHRPKIVTMSGDASISATGVVTVVNATADKITITDDTTTNATMYPMWVNATTGDLTAYVSSTKLRFNPSTSTLTCTNFAGNASTATNADQLDTYHAATFGASLDTSGNNVILKNPGGTTLSTITVPYATNATTAGYAATAGDADTVDGHHAADFREVGVDINASDMDIVITRHCYVILEDAGAGYNWDYWDSDTGAQSGTGASGTITVPLYIKDNMGTVTQGGTTNIVVDENEVPQNQIFLYQIQYDYSELTITSTGGGNPEATITVEPPPHITKYVRSRGLNANSIRLESYIPSYTFDYTIVRGPGTDEGSILEVHWHYLNTVFDAA